MSRSIWKGPFIDKSLIKFSELNKLTEQLNVWSRRSTVPFFMVGKYALVHNGLDFKKIFVNRDKVGFKFGSFAKTRKFTKKVKGKK